MSTTASLTVVPVDPRADPRWAALAAGPAASVFTSPPWLRAICSTYDFTPHARILVDEQGAPTDGFTWVPISDLRGDRLASVPFSDRAEPFGCEPSVWADLAADPLRSGLAMTLRCLADAPALGHPDLQQVGSAAWHGLPLGAGDEEIFARFTSETRRGIRIADRNGLRVVTHTDIDAVRRFHELHVALRKRKYRLLAQPVDLFERLWQEFSPHEAVVTLLAYHDNQLVAGALYLVWNDVLYYKFAASVGEYLSLRPNEAIQWAAIQWATERGLTLLDWGLSDLNQPGLLSYKRKWGTEERRITTARTAGPAPDPEAGRVLGEVTDLLTDDAVPDEITARAGALLYRHFC